MGITGPAGSLKNMNSFAKKFQKFLKNECKFKITNLSNNNILLVRNFDKGKYYRNNNPKNATYMEFGRLL